jgi:hypothetical protein
MNRVRRADPTERSSLLCTYCLGGHACPSKGGALPQYRMTMGSQNVGCVSYMPTISPGCADLSPNRDFSCVLLLTCFVHQVSRNVKWICAGETCTLYRNNSIISNPLRLALLVPFNTSHFLCDRHCRRLEESNERKQELSISLRSI